MKKFIAILVAIMIIGTLLVSCDDVLYISVYRPDGESI